MGSRGEGAWGTGGGAAVGEGRDPCAKWSSLGV